MEQYWSRMDGVDGGYWGGMDHWSSMNNGGSMYDRGRVHNGGGMDHWYWMCHNRTVTRIRGGNWSGG